MNRANSCQSDSSGFLEEPPEPPPLQVEGPLRVEIGTEGLIRLKCVTTVEKNKFNLSQIKASELTSSLQANQEVDQA